MIYPFIDIGNGTFTVNGLADDTPVRVVDEDPVYLVTQIDVLNNDGDQWYLQIKQNNVVVFEALCVQQTETHTALAPSQQFETGELEVRASRNIIN